MTNPKKLGARWRLRAQVKALRALPLQHCKKVVLPSSKKIGKVGLRPGSNSSPKVTQEYKNVIKGCLFRSQDTRSI